MTQGGRPAMWPRLKKKLAAAVMIGAPASWRTGQWACATSQPRCWLNSMMQCLLHTPLLDFMESISATVGISEAICHYSIVLFFESVFLPKSNVFFFRSCWVFFSYKKQSKLATTCNNGFFHLRNTFLLVWFLPCFDTQLEFRW